jgi:hypothetical protein
MTCFRRLEDASKDFATSFGWLASEDASPEVTPMVVMEPLKILHTDVIYEDQLIVDFSDGTTAFFTPAQLASLAAERVLTELTDHEDLFQA